MGGGRVEEGRQAGERQGCQHPSLLSNTACWKCTDTAYVSLEDWVLICLFLKFLGKH